MVKKVISCCFLLLLIMGCESTNTVFSKNYKLRSERINVLKKYFNLRSEIIDTEYKIYDVNINNRSIPGPTDRDYKIILKVNADDLDKWYELDNITSFPINYNWAIDLLETNGNNNFDLSGVNLQFSSENKEMIIFKETGEILINIVQH